MREVLKKTTTLLCSVTWIASDQRQRFIWSRLYLAERRHVTERSVLNDLVVLAGVTQLGVGFHSLGGQADSGGLAAGGIGGVHVVVPLKDHQLALSLRDVCGEGLQDVAQRHFHLGFYLSPCCQTGGQLHFVKNTTVERDKHLHKAIKYQLLMDKKNG